MTILTFGKYKNKDILEIVKKDKYYIIWLLKQPWFEEKHKHLYNETKNILNDYKPIINKDKFIIYTDGACPDNGSDKARSSIGIHFSDKNELKINDISEKLHDINHSNNIAELMAIYKSLTIIQSNQIKIPIYIYTDSSYCEKILNEWYEKWIRNNLLDGKKNIDLIKKTYDIFKSLNNVSIMKVKGHSKNTDEHSYGNYIADKLARNALKI